MAVGAEAANSLSFHPNYCNCRWTRLSRAGPNSIGVSVTWSVIWPRATISTTLPAAGAPAMHAESKKISNSRHAALDVGI